MQLQFVRNVSSGLFIFFFKKKVHRDLAARNVLIGEHLRAKVSDFGLTRDTHGGKDGDGGDYYRVKSAKNQLLPLRWTAPEVLVGLKYTVSSDIYALVPSGCLNCW